MLIATFGPSTGWAGKTITREGEYFILQDHGPITATDVMEYDRQGQLVWANDRTRAWVGSRAAPPSQPVAGPPGHIPPIGAGLPAARSKKGLPGWAIALVAVVALMVVLVSVLFAVTQAAQRHFDARLKEDSVRLGVAQLGLAVQLYGSANHAYPSTSDLGLALIGTPYLTSGWPTNPFSGQVMASGTGPGDYTYTVRADLQSYTLVGYGKDGQVILTMPRDALTGQ
jgi:Type II secretion system (T2SS), protein G